MKEKVDHPKHYGGDTVYETIKVIEAWEFPDGIGFHLGNAIKYISRCAHKGDVVENLEKAAWYLNRAIKVVRLKANEEGSPGA